MKLWHICNYSIIYKIYIATLKSLLIFLLFYVLMYILLIKTVVSAWPLSAVSPEAGYKACQMCFLWFGISLVWVFSSIFIFFSFSFIFLFHLCGTSLMMYVSLCPYVYCYV